MEEICEIFYTAVFFFSTIFVFLVGGYELIQFVRRTKVNLLIGLCVVVVFLIWLVDKYNK